MIAYSTRRQFLKTSAGLIALATTGAAFDFKKEKWTARVRLPEDMAQTHVGEGSDEERYIYLVSGQLGADCRPATTNCFVFDAKNRSFGKLPPLPQARYAPTVQVWRGRLHSVAGAKEDRNTPSVDHWSIAVENGKAIEKEWRWEPPLPHGGHHRASAVIQNALYVFGGQEGDYIAIPGDPDCRCTAESLCTSSRWNRGRRTHRSGPGCPGGRSRAAGRTWAGGAGGCHRAPGRSRRRET